MSHALVPSFCDLRCHHRLPFNDCLVRAVLRALHAHYPDCPIVVLFFVGVVVGAIGWKLRDAAPGSVYPGVHLTRPIGTTILLHATVLAPVVHDDAVVIYVCAITHVSFGSSVVHLPPRLLLLEIPVGAPNKLGICDTDCECGIHFAGASRLVLAALRHRLLQYPIETVPITAVSLLPSIDYYMNFVVPPAQYVDTFTEHIGTSVAGPVAHDILQDNGQLPLPVIGTDNVVSVIP